MRKNLPYYRSIPTFLWYHIKPYKWFYMGMMAPPVLECFLPSTMNYGIKMLVDELSLYSPASPRLLGALVLMISSYLIMILAWQIATGLHWKSTPYVEASIILKSYDRVQHYSPLFFQNNFTGTITSKIGGLLTGYDRIWSAIRLGAFFHVFITVVDFLALLWINHRLGLFLGIWGVWFALMLPVFVRLSQKCIYPPVPQPMGGMLYWEE